MNPLKILIRIVSPAVLVALAIGCTTTKSKESMLSAAGFRMIPATTPEQLAHLKTLKANQITMAQQDGKTYYTYPDAAHDVLYVGEDAQYQEYQKLRLQKQMADEQVNAAEMNNTAPWGAWGAFGRR